MPPKLLDNVSLLVTNGGPADGLKRRERCLASQEVLDALGLQDPNSDFTSFDNHGQIRVVPVDLSNGRSGNFTIVGMSNEIGRKITVYGPQAVDKLAKNDEADLDLVRVLRPAPSEVTLDGESISSWRAGLGEVAGGSFTETGTIGRDLLALLAPHGGNIEVEISDQLDTITERLHTLAPSLEPTLWRCEGFSSPNHTRFHITSNDIEEGSFPALSQIWAQFPPIWGGKRFRYVLALHGMAGETNEIIIGGRASEADKQVLKTAILKSFAVEPGRTPPTIVVASLNDEGHLNGIGETNIINRLCVNDGEPNAGGFQIEQSKDLRDDETKRQLIANGLAVGLSWLLNDDDVAIRSTLGGPVVKYASPDLCIRHSDLPADLADDVALPNEEIQDNNPAQVFVRVHNHGAFPTLRHYYAHVFDSTHSTLLEPSEWLTFGTIDLGPLAPGSTTSALSVEPIDDDDTHYLVCIVDESPVPSLPTEDARVAWRFYRR